MANIKKETKKNRSMERNIIAKNTTIVGDIISEGDFRIDGNLEGSIKTTGKIIIGVEGFVKGKAESENADIEGKFSGTLTLQNTLTIKSSSSILGEVAIGKLSVEPGAIFNANCVMKGAVKELNKNEQEQSSEKTA